MNFDRKFQQPGYKPPFNLLCVRGELAYSAEYGTPISPERSLLLLEALEYFLSKERPVVVEVKGRQATHYCVECGALWKLYPDSWSLVSLSCGTCCDNVEMGTQIKPIVRTESDGWTQL